VADGDEGGDRPDARDEAVTSWWVIAVAGILTQLLTTISGVLAARMLGVEGRGQVVLVAVLAATASQLTLGGSLPNAITKQLAERRVTARDGLRRMPRKWAPWGLLAAAIAGAYLLFLEWDTSGSTKYALAAAVVLMGLQLMAQRILIGAMLGERANPVHIALTGVLPQALVVAVYAVATAMDADWSPVELLSVNILCTGLVLVARLRGLAPATNRPEDRLDPTELNRLARHTHIGSIGPIDGLAIDRMLVGSLLGNAQLGLYSVAFALGGLTNIFAICLAQVSLPHISSLQSSPEAESKFVRRWLLTTLILLGVVVAVLEAALVPIIEVTFGPEFLDATECARWMLLASGLLGFRRVLIAVLQGRDRGRTASVTELALTPLVVIGIVLAAAADSLVGASVTMLCVGAASCLILGVAVYRSEATGIDARAAAEAEPLQS
jgi:O-antigen/teichoic acid export membrane protein